MSSILNNVNFVYMHNKEEILICLGNTDYIFKNFKKPSEELIAWWMISKKPNWNTILDNSIKLFIYKDNSDTNYDRWRKE